MKRQDRPYSSKERTPFEMLMKVQRLVTKGIRGLRAGWSNSGKLAGPICIVLLSLLLEGCARQSVHEPVTLTLLEEWTSRAFSDARQQELQQFTRDTGIQVNLLPSPESARQKLVLWKELLGGRASGPDVYGIDVIRPGMLSEYFIDLRPYFAEEIPLQFTAIAAGFTVNNKVIAILNRPAIGVFFFRTDLLRRYGYRGPPGTWDELETMAARIQAGGRGQRKKQVLGVLWAGGGGGGA